MPMPYRNLVELHRCQAERLGPLPAVAHRRNGLWRNLSWEEYHADVLACAAALVASGIKPGDRVGILSENRPEWLIADLGLMTAGAVNVPPHAPLSPSQIRYQLGDAGVVWLFVSDRNQLAKVRLIRTTLPDLRGIVLFEGGSEADVVTWEAFLAGGRRALAKRRSELRRRELALGADDLATVMYTSGTTGDPRGVMLTHGNLLSNALATLQASPFRPDDVVLGWLPLTHIYARLVDHYATMAAGILFCMAGSQETLIRDLKECQPMSFASVPRFYEKVLAAVNCPDPTGTGRALRRVFGSRINHLMSGGAPLPSAVGRAYQEAGLLLLQGYGLTETSPVITCNRQNLHKPDTVGTPLPGVEVRIAADGEILTRGPHVMKGYWKNPQATAACIVDGWFHTGDLGHLDADGFLSITGRKKELLVMSNGKKVVPSYLEGLLLADPCIDQAVVCGEGRNYLTALIVPHWENVRQALRAEGVELAAGVTDDPAVQDLLTRRIRERLLDVSPMEQIRKILVVPQPFSVEAEEMTVSLKLRRSVVLRKYDALLNDLYGE
jgi:long-chain acyl-CoA synthetase